MLKQILSENEARHLSNAGGFDPLTGRDSVGERLEWTSPAGETLWLPTAMLQEMKVKGDADFERLRCRHDFPYWCAKYVMIKNKEGGDDIPFVLTRPQRKFVARLEEFRTANQPIRLVLLKARQWGGSTTSQIYMAWLQLVHKKGMNSLIIAQQNSASYTIKDMFDRMLEYYPASMLAEGGEKVSPSEPKIKPVGRTGTIFRVPLRNCKITIGSAERPNSCRGGDYNLVHCSEVGVWKATAGKTPEDIVRSACSGILLRPYTMIIYESTANGIGNFFHREYEAAKREDRRSQFRALFISWYDIDLYAIPFPSEEEKVRFAESLYEHRECETPLSDREESGRYLWWLWTRGATLEAINWYVEERQKYSDHAQMASEYPSDDIEAFAHSGKRVFDRYKVEGFRSGCRRELLRGEMTADGREGYAALANLRFVSDTQGALQIWEEPDGSGEGYSDRYLTVVDIGGRSEKADYSVIAVFDRTPQVRGEGPVVVAQWYGHTDMDILAWKAVQIAEYYHQALLVVESNTLETRDLFHDIDGDQSHFILNQIRDVYPNLYARRQSEQAVVQGMPVRYGFHTNAATKPMIISSLVKIVREGLYVERDERCLDEFLTYEKKPNGSFGAILGRHDDLLMTRAIALHLAYNELPAPAPAPAAPRERVRKRTFL